MTDQPWIRREDENSGAYTAFKAYLYQGKDRSLTALSAQEQISRSLLGRWSIAYDWTERCRAYDSYVMTADVDGMVHAIAHSRDKNLALMDKLRSHLSDRLDTFIARKEDPTIRWTQALTAMAKVEQNSLLLKDDVKTDERVGRIEALVERALTERTPREGVEK
jgi:hypothetical protein